MSGAGCERAPLVEAMFDGRLGPTEHASIERHLNSCDSCSERVRELSSLQTLLRSSASMPSRLEHQRARIGLLSRTARPVSKRRRPVALIVGVLLTMPVAVWAATSPSSPLRQTHAVSNTLSPSVKPEIKHKPARRELAPTPTPTMDTMPAPTTESPLPPSAATPLEPVTSAPMSHLRRVHHAARATAATLGAARASQDFAAAMQALARGDFGASAQQLDSFASTFPHDSRAEDALYLEAIALERAGRQLDARIIARRYVSVYPSGAHYAQALRIAGD